MRETSASSGDDREHNSTAVIDVGTGQEIALRSATKLPFDSPVFFTEKGFQLYLCKELLESLEPSANAMANPETITGPRARREHDGAKERSQVWC